MVILDEIVGPSISSMFQCFHCHCSIQMNVYLYMVYSCMNVYDCSSGLLFVNCGKFYFCLVI